MLWSIYIALLVLTRLSRGPYAKVTSETCKKKGFHYPARKASIAMVISIPETRARASASDSHGNKSPRTTMKFSRSQESWAPQSTKALTPNLRLVIFQEIDVCGGKGADQVEVPALALLSMGGGTLGMS